VTVNKRWRSLRPPPWKVRFRTGGQEQNGANVRAAGQGDWEAGRNMARMNPCYLQAFTGWGMRRLKHRKVLINKWRVGEVTTQWYRAIQSRHEKWHKHTQKNQNQRCMQWDRGGLTDEKMWEYGTGTFWMHSASTGVPYEDEREEDE